MITTIKLGLPHGIRQGRNVVTGACDGANNAVHQATGGMLGHALQSTAGTC